MPRMRDGLSCHVEWYEGQPSGPLLVACVTGLTVPQVGAKDLACVCSFFWMISVTVVTWTCGLQDRATRFF